MFLNNTDKELISRLKGRLSKALNIQSKLSKEEKICMEGIYNTLDKVILTNKEDSKEIDFTNTFIYYSERLKITKRKYIKDHIIPLVTKIVTKKWGTNE